MSALRAISVAIPSYRREQVLLNSIRELSLISSAGTEILIIDQTPQHEAPVEAQLTAWNAEGAIRWIRSELPSIPMAMNVALREAKNDIVLFLDDDIVPDEQLLAAHREAHTSGEALLVAGRVLQPWHKGVKFAHGEPFHFACLDRQPVYEFMGGNFSISRKAAIELGGFDENFVKVAYRFEAEFAHRWCASGRQIVYEPKALIHHLKAVEGGTRTFGTHLTTTRPDHAVGEYYYFFVTKNGSDLIRAITKRLLNSVRSKHHLRRPWWIPMTLFAEVRGLIWAARMYRRGPMHIQQTMFDGAHAC